MDWTYTGLKLSTVDIIFDPNGDEDVSGDGTTLQAGGDRDAGTSFVPLNSLPYTTLM